MGEHDLVIKHSLSYCLLMSTSLWGQQALAIDYFVTNTNDSGPGSLRTAIENSNSTTSVFDEIHFSIADAPPNLIVLDSALPDITDPVIIDGYTEPDAHPNTLEEGSDAVLVVGISGENSVPTGLVLRAGNTTVRGLVIMNFGATSIRIPEGGNNTIAGNYIGLSFDGSPANRRPYFGIEVGSSGNVIGGSQPGDRNVITALSIGIDVLADNNDIMGNYIGSRPDGSFLDAGATQKWGIRNGDEFNAVDGTNIGSPGQGNLIVSTQRGIYIDFSENVLIRSNEIGRAAQKNGYGIYVKRDTDNIVIGGTQPDEGNSIAHNHRNGVAVVADAAGTSITRNSIHHNGRLGIDVLGKNGIYYQSGPTENDDQDPDDQPGNDGQNFPMLTSAVRDVGDIKVSGTFNSLPNQDFVIEFFGNTVLEPADAMMHHHGEGEFYLGSLPLTTDGLGNAPAFNNFSLPLGDGWCISATATHVATGNTSEFSPCEPMYGDICTVTSTVNSGLNSLRDALASCVNSISSGLLNLVDIQLGSGDIITLEDPPPVVSGPLRVAGTLSHIEGSPGMVGTLALGDYAFLENISVVAPKLGAGLLCDGDYFSVYGGTHTGDPPALCGLAGAANFGIIQNAHLATTGFSSLQLNSNHGVLLDVSTSGSIILEGARNLIANSSICAPGQPFGLFAPLGPDGNQLSETTISCMVRTAEGLDPVNFDIAPQGPNPQVPGDPDNAPLLSSSERTGRLAEGSGRATRVQGSLDSTPDTTFTIEVFVNTSGCSEGALGPADAFLGFFEVTTDSDGIANFDETIAAPTEPGDYLLATATEDLGNTSEFSTCVPAEQLVTTLEFSDGFETP